MWRIRLWIYTYTYIYIYIYIYINLGSGKVVQKLILLPASWLYQSQELKILGISRYKFKLRFWSNLNLYQGIWVTGFGGFWGCSIFCELSYDEFILFEWWFDEFIRETWHDAAWRDSFMRDTWRGNCHIIIRIIEIRIIVMIIHSNHTSRLSHERVTSHSVMTCYTRIWTSPNASSQTFECVTSHSVMSYIYIYLHILYVYLKTLRILCILSRWEYASSTLQHTATHCTTLQHTATHCSTLQHAATRCITAAYCNTLQNTLQQNTRLQRLGNRLHPGTGEYASNTLQPTATHSITLQHTCNTLYHTATHMQHTIAHCNTHATHCITLQHTVAH